MWSAFADIPANLEEEIEVDFYCWKKGTYRFVPKLSRWHWFDGKLPNGLAADFNLVS
jgi:hypothetical protein